MNFRKLMFALGLTVAVGMALPLRAQTGCDDSPEDPTVVLAMVGSAGAFAASMWRIHKKQDK
jgi:XrtJ-associated TM-motif-TM protein